MHQTRKHRTLCIDGQYFDEFSFPGGNRSPCSMSLCYSPSYYSSSFVLSAPLCKILCSVWHFSYLNGTLKFSVIAKSQQRYKVASKNVWTRAVPRPDIENIVFLKDGDPSLNPLVPFPLCPALQSVKSLKDCLTISHTTCDRYLEVRSSSITRFTKKIHQGNLIQSMDVALDPRVYLDEMCLRYTGMVRLCEPASISLPPCSASFSIQGPENVNLHCACAPGASTIVSFGWFPLSRTTHCSSFKRVQLS